GSTSLADWPNATDEKTSKTATTSAQRASMTWIQSKSSDEPEYILHDSWFRHPFCDFTLQH
ncbi:MAG: hypothetical protein R3C56_43530, partial [Pirellulaceae bacterium]